MNLSAECKDWLKLKILECQFEGFAFQNARDMKKINYDYIKEQYINCINLNHDILRLFCYKSSGGYKNDDP